MGEVADIVQQSGRNGKKSSVVVVPAKLQLWGMSGLTVNKDFDEDKHSEQGRQSLLSWRESTCSGLASLEGGGDCPTTQVLWIRATKRSLQHASAK
jgi:hypothetical protein